MRMPTDRFRAAPPPGVTVRSTSSADRRHGAALRELVSDEWPHWLPVLDRAIALGTVTGPSSPATAPDRGQWDSLPTPQSGRGGWAPSAPAPATAGAASRRQPSAALWPTCGPGRAADRDRVDGNPGYFADRGAEFAHGYLHLRKDLVGAGASAAAARRSRRPRRWPARPRAPATSRRRRSRGCGAAAARRSTSNRPPVAVIAAISASPSTPPATTPAPSKGPGRPPQPAPRPPPQPSDAAKAMDANPSSTALSASWSIPSPKPSDSAPGCRAARCSTPTTR